jgi:hypothetical protein
MLASSATSGSSRCSVSCRLTKGTYIAGERLTGFISISTTADNVDIEEVSVQVHGHVKVDPRWVLLPSSLTLRQIYAQGTNADKGGKEKSPEHHFSAGVFGTDENSACVFAVPPVVLVSRERVDEHSVAHFSFSVDLPTVLYPTFRGVGVKYLYAVTLVACLAAPVTVPSTLSRLLRRGSLMPASPTTISKEMHIPFVVLGSGPLSPGAELLPSSSIPPLPPPLTAELAAGPTSPDQESVDGVASLVSGTQVTMIGLQGVPGEARDREGPYVFSIRSGEMNVCKLILQHLKYEPGEVILGNFDFSGAGCLCWQISAALQMIEMNGYGRSSKGEPSVIHRQVIDTYHELTPCAERSSMSLAVPPNAALSIDAPFAAVRWAIKVQFTVGPLHPGLHCSPEEVKDARCSVLRWEVPLHVIPPDMETWTDMESQWSRSAPSREMSL